MAFVVAIVFCTPGSAQIVFPIPGVNVSVPTPNNPPTPVPSAPVSQASSTGAPEQAAAAGIPTGGQTQNSTAPGWTPCSGYVFQGGCEVFTDEYGHPHYRIPASAPNSNDVFFALGFDHMRRFPVATMYNLRLAEGDLAPRLGKRYLNKDISIKHWQVEQTAKGYIPCPPPAADLDWRQVLAAYTAGLNAGRQLWMSGTWLSTLVHNTEPISLGFNDLERLLGSPADPTQDIQEWHVMAWATVQQNHLPLSAAAETFSTILQTGAPSSPVWQASSPVYDPYGILPGGANQAGPCPPILPASNSWMLHPSIVS